MTESNIKQTKAGLITGLAKGGSELLKLSERMVNDVLNKNSTPDPSILASVEDFEIAQNTIQQIIIDITTPKDALSAMGELVNLASGERS